MNEQVQSLHDCIEFLYTHIAKANIKEYTTAWLWKIK
jgi:hypothetical protein